MLKVDYFPTDAPEKPPHGTVFSYSSKFGSLADAFNAGCPVYAFLHGLGYERGTGKLAQLKVLHGMAMFKNGVFNDPTDPAKPGAIELDDIIHAMVQTDTGYDAGEIPFLLSKIDGYNPKAETTLQGLSWGGWGILGNVGSGKVNPRNLSAIWLLAPGNNAERRAAFVAAMKGVTTPVYIVWNQNDTTVKTGVNELYNALKAQGNRVALIRYRNVWTSSDGSKTSHAPQAFVFPSRWWSMFTTDPASSASKVYADVLTNDAVLLKNFYAMLKRDLDFIEPPIVVDPRPDPVTELGEIQTTTGARLKISQGLSGEIDFSLIK